MSRNRIFLVFALLLASSYATAPIMASVVSTTPAVVAVPAPPSVEPNQYSFDTEIHVFDERQCIRLEEDLVVDSSQPGPVPSPPVSILIAAGTEVSCHFLHYNPSDLTNAAGTATFDSDILGVIVNDPTLDDSDSVCGLASTSYPTGTDKRAAEQPTDAVIIDPNLRTVAVDWTAGHPGDQARVITRCTPSIAIAKIEAKLDQSEPQLLENQAALEAKLDNLQSQVDDLSQVLNELQEALIQIEAKLDERP